MLKRLLSLFLNPTEEAIKAELSEAVREANEEVQQFLADPGAAVPQYNDLGEVEKVVVDGVLLQFAAKAQDAANPLLAQVWGRVEDIAADTPSPAPVLDFIGE